MYLLRDMTQQKDRIYKLEHRSIEYIQTEAQRGEADGKYSKEYKTHMEKIPNMIFSNTVTDKRKDRKVPNNRFKMLSICQPI